MKSSQQSQALVLRRDGLTYAAIQERLEIAKSTLWRWLKTEGLVDGQSQQYTERRLLAQRKAVQTVRRIRVEKTEAIMAGAAQEINGISTRELCLIGAALYWAEGSKQKEHKGQVSQQVVFVNTDPRMLRLFVRFLERCCGIPSSELRFRIYLHETASATEAQVYWCNQLGIDALRSAPITWKRHKPTIFRTNVGSGYHGLVRVVVTKSTDLNRRIGGWIDGICVGIGE